MKKLTIVTSLDTLSIVINALSGFGNIQVVEQHSKYHVSVESADQESLEKIRKRMDKFLRLNPSKNKSKSTKVSTMGPASLKVVEFMGNRFEGFTACTDGMFLGKPSKNRMEALASLLKTIPFKGFKGQLKLEY